MADNFYFSIVAIGDRCVRSKNPEKILHQSSEERRIFNVGWMKNFVNIPQLLECKSVTGKREDVTDVAFCSVIHAVLKEA
jgi:hypothetical protein